MTARPRVAAVEVTTDVGTLLLPAVDDVVRPWMAEYGCWEPEEAGLLRSLARPGGYVVDLGAHVGYHTLVAAAAVGPTGTVLAVEACRANAELLRANVRRAGLGNVRIVAAAAWDRPGRVRVDLSAANSGDHRVRPWPPGRRWSRWPRGGARAMRLDDLLRGRRVDVVKSDLQGRDHVALRGMAETLRSWRPVVLVEFWPEGIRDLGDDPAAVLAWYAGLGYTVAPLGPREGARAADLVAAAEAADGGFLTLRLDP